MLVVPDRLNRNAPAVQAMAPPADTGRWLIEYMCERIGLADLADLDMLDLGCGVRFADAIVNHGIPVRSYCGVELDREIVDFLAANVTDPRLSFAHFDIWHNLYHRTGEPLSPALRLPIGDRSFDVICMFSVITHQVPADAGALFLILRRYVRPTGHLFFSATVEEGEFGYRERFPDVPTGHSIYTLDLLSELLAAGGWRVRSLAGKHPRELPIQDSFVCEPV
jgi:SAM-dependent methyltransferase